nr:uncharacterized protein LOC118969938 isoform X2 [Manis javanica]
MLTRKPSAAAPAAYPTGKEGRGLRAALPPRATLEARASLPAEAGTKSAPRRGSAGSSGRTARPRLGSASGGLRACRAGTAPGLLPPGLGWAVALCSPVLFPACNVGLRAPARGVANTRLGPTELCSCPSTARGCALGIRVPGAVSAPPPDGGFYSWGSVVGRAGFAAQRGGAGRRGLGDSPLTPFCLHPRVVPRQRRGQRHSSASGFPGARRGAPSERSGVRPALPNSLPPLRASNAAAAAHMVRETDIQDSCITDSGLLVWKYRRQGLNTYIPVEYQCCKDSN